LLSQNKKILNTKEIKESYLKQLKIEKSNSSITKEQYYSVQNTEDKTPQQ
jgi:hypothetical protein